MTRKKRCPDCKKNYHSVANHKRFCPVAQGQRTRTGRAMIREGHPEDLVPLVCDTNGVVHEDDPLDIYLKEKERDAHGEKQAGAIDADA